MSATKRPHSWILASADPLIRRPRGRRSWPLSDMARKLTERSGKGSAQAAAATLCPPSTAAVDSPTRRSSHGIQERRDPPRRSRGLQPEGLRGHDRALRRQHLAGPTTPRAGRSARREEFRTDFLAGWVGVSSDIRITDPRYLDAGQTVVSTFTVAGTQDGPLGPFPATGKEFALPLCEMWHFDADRAGRRRRPLLRPALAAHAAGPDAAAVRRVAGAPDLRRAPAGRDAHRRAPARRTGFRVSG